MKRLLLLLLASAAFAQGVRVDVPPILNSRGTPIPNANISLCPGTASVTGSNCSPATATGFTDITLGTACTVGSPVTLTSSNICQSTGDPLGNAGFWLAPGAYIYCINAPSTVGKCYNLTAPAGVTPAGNANLGGTGFQINGAAAPSGHVPRGNGTNYIDGQVAAADLSNGTTGSGATVLATSPTITTPALSSPTITGTASGTATLPQGMVTPGSNGQCLITTGGATAWGTCAGLTAPQINTTAVNASGNTSALQNLQSVTFAANTFNTAGKTFTIAASGVFTPGAATGQTITIFFAGLGLISTNSTQAIVLANSTLTTQYQFTFHIVCSTVTTGASGNFACTLSGGAVNNNGVTNLTVFAGSVNPTNAVNLTTTLTLTVQIAFSTASTSNTASGLHLAVIPNN